MNDPTPSEIIERLGGVSATAKLCEVEPPSVSEWMNGRRGRPPRIPRARLMYLKAVRPDVFTHEYGHTGKAA